ncbi:hypothetical protein V8B97DRAFT_1913928 [Scleroderma yunnanense]
MDLVVNLSNNIANSGGAWWLPPPTAMTIVTTSVNNIMLEFSCSTVHTTHMLISQHALLFMCLQWVHCLLGMGEVPTQTHRHNPGWNATYELQGHSGSLCLFITAVWGYEDALLSSNNYLGYKDACNETSGSHFPKLTDTNYSNWSIMMEAELIRKGLWTGVHASSASPPGTQDDAAMSAMTGKKKEPTHVEVWCFFCDQLGHKKSNFPEWARWKASKAGGSANMAVEGEPDGIW